MWNCIRDGQTVEVKFGGKETREKTSVLSAARVMCMLCLMHSRQRVPLVRQLCRGYTILIYTSLTAVT